MSKQNNLTEFLTGVAEAIREKKGTTALINPQDFENEILSITTGTDTADATAVADDILNGKTAYAKGSKVTGSIKTYDGTFVTNPYTITATLTNVVAASGNAVTIATGETKVLTYIAASGYSLPDTITVVGATGVWDKTNGTLTLSNPTENITFTIIGLAIAYTITTNLTNMVGDSSNAKTIKTKESVVLGFTPTGDYIYPYSVTVTGAESQYNPQNGYVYLKNATSDVTITLNATKVGILGNSKITFKDRPAKPSTDVSFYANGTTIQMVDEAYSRYYITNISCDKYSGALTYGTNEVAGDTLGVAGTVYSVSGIIDGNTGKEYEAYEWIIPAAKELKVFYDSLELDQSDLNWMKANATITKL